MIRALLRPGFLGTHAPLYADLSLLLMLCTAVVFTFGWRLALRRRFAAHRRVQTAAVILNTFVVLAVMVASFIIYIVPGIPGKLLEGTYGVTTLHAVIGTLAMLLGVFIVLRGRNQVPRWLRFKNYKLFMRASYVLYMLTTIIGVLIYAVVYTAE
jgi:uncharacterized membrane protein YozB (DUF420 family)